MKRVFPKITAVLLLLLLLFSLTGCSQAELGYLELSKEALALNGITIDSQISIDLTDDKLNQLTGLELGKHLDVRITGLKEQTQGIYDLEIAYRLDTTGAYLPVCRLAYDGEANYVSTEGIWRIIKAYRTEDFSPEYIAEMDAYIASHPFVRMTEEDWVLNWHFGRLETPVGSQWNDLLDTMASLLEGFETELVTEADGTYQFSASGSDLLSLADRFLVYLQDNPTAGYGMALTWQTFKQDFLSSNGINAPSPALTESSWQASLQKQADRRSKHQASERQAPIGANDSIAVSLKMTGNPGSRVLTSASSLVIDKVGAAIQTSAVLTEQTIQGVPYFNAVSGNTFDAGLEAINDRYTLTTGVRLEPEEDGFASAFIEQTFCGRPSGNLNYASMYYINNQYYIGANDLTRILPGAQVTAAHGQATIVFNGRTAVLDTQPALNTSDKEVPFVSVRELTQLGLSVDYQSPPEIITLTFQ